MTVSTRTAVIPPLIGFKATDEWNDIDGCPFALGTRVQCNDGTIWRLVKAASALTSRFAYMIPSTYIVADKVTTSNDDVSFLGVPAQANTAPTSLNASATYTFFWIQTGGECPFVKTKAIVASGNEVHSSDVDGSLEDASGIPLVGAKWTSAQAAVVSGYASMYCPQEYVFEAA